MSGSGPSPIVSQPAGAHTVHKTPPLPAAKAGGLVLAFVMGLCATSLVESVRRHPLLVSSVVGAGGVLLVWLLLLVVRRHTGLRLELVPRKQHYVQACAQGAFLLYWGWFWPQVYDSAMLIVAQVLFAYAFDILLGWSHRGHYQLGFGPVPVVLSINLFLWFANEVYYLQFLLVAVAFAAKAFVRWEKEGRLVHIFNPAAFALTTFSVALILSGTTYLTWGQDIAVSQFYPPHVYLVLFLIGLPGQLLFGVTSMTMAAVVVTYLFGLAYFAATGVYYFYDSYIPIAVFLGMHLLFTDPSTSPRTELGRLLFGALYGMSTIGLYALLGHAGFPTFYDKLLAVPFLNLSIKGLDRIARAGMLRRLDPGTLGRFMTPRRRRMAYVAVWTAVFATMSAAQGVGDRHPGQWLPFWQQACIDERPHACLYLVTRQSTHCDQGSGWACNEAGTLQVALWRRGRAAGRFDAADAAMTFERGCELGFTPACENLLAVLAGSGAVASGPPPLKEYPIILRGSKGPITDVAPAAVLAQACTQGWPDTCAPGSGTSR